MEKRYEQDENLILLLDLILLFLTYFVSFLNQKEKLINKKL